MLSEKRNVVDYCTICLCCCCSLNFLEKSKINQKVIYYIFNHLKMINCRRPILGPIYLCFMYLFHWNGGKCLFLTGSVINKSILWREFCIFADPNALWDGLYSGFKTKRPSCSHLNIVNMVASCWYFSLVFLENYECFCCLVSWNTVLSY